MHKIAKEIMDRIKSKINACGIDAITEQELIEMKYWACVADAMTSYDYHFKIIEEMEKPENKYGETYDENGRFYTPPRSSNGQFRPDMRKHYDGMIYDRDMDMDKGRMYYTDPDMRGYDYASGGNVGSNNASSVKRNMGNRGYSQASNPSYHESGYERARRGFEEAKMTNPSADNMEKIEDMFGELEEEIEELKPKMSTTEKQFSRNKLNNMANMMV